MHIVWGSTRKPESSKLLAESFDDFEEDECALYIGYPIISGIDSVNTVDALLLSKNKGVIAICVIEGTDECGYEEVQDELYGKIYSKLISNRTLIKKREPLFKLHVVTFAPVSKEKDFDDDYPIFYSSDSLKKWIEDLDGAEEEVYKPLVAAVQSLTNIRPKRAKRKPLHDSSRGAILDDLDASIANLDARQSSAVIETIDGVQRIRGLAGSGKTIILALKVAYLHASVPDWNIAVTFNTRSLKGLFERLINTFYIDQAGEEPDWDKIHILHAWGSAGPGNRGIYYESCLKSKGEYLDFGSAKSLFGYEQAFDGACNNILEYIVGSNIDVSGEYDVILVDEAQDFSGAFLKLCYELLTDEKRLVYAYDELQSLDEKTLPSPEQLFGVELKNEPGKPKKDIILEKCYRNPRQILTSAHALGFGIYAEGGDLVQMFDDSGLWLDIGYSVSEGELADGKHVVLERTESTSPTFLESHSKEDDIVNFFVWDDVESQAKWIVEEIEKNIKEDGLRPEDIVVVNPNALRTRDATGPLRRRLFDKGIDSCLVGVSSSKDKFYNEGKVAFSGVHRVKGNEAGMVYIINADYCYRGVELAKKRNILFTSMTRSKAWLRVSGVGQNMQGLADEFSRLKAKNFKLDFVYPTLDERERMRLINRDLSDEERRAFNKKKKDIERSLYDLANGDVRLEDLSEEVVARIRGLLK